MANKVHMVDVAQLVSAPDCGSGGRGFESLHPPHFILMAGVARGCFYFGMSPSGKAPDFDSGIRRFESCHPSQYDPLAQSAEHLPFKQGVRSSNLRRVTKKVTVHLWAVTFFIKIVIFCHSTGIGCGTTIPHRYAEPPLHKVALRLVTYPLILYP